MTSECKVRRSRMGEQAQTCPAVCTPETLKEKWKTLWPFWYIYYTVVHGVIVYKSCFIMYHSFRVWEIFSSVEKTTDMLRLTFLSFILKKHIWLTKTVCYCRCNRDMVNKQYVELFTFMYIIHKTKSLNEFMIYLKPSYWKNDKKKNQMLSFCQNWLHTLFEKLYWNCPWTK